MSIDPFVVVQSPAVFREIHMLVEARRHTWEEFSKDGFALLLCTLCCPDDHVQQVLRRWAAAKTHYGSEDCGYDALEELAKGGDPMLFAKQTAESGLDTQKDDAAASHLLEDLSETFVEKRCKDEVCQRVMERMTRDGLDGKLRSVLTNHLAQDKSLAVLVSKDFVAQAIREVEPRLKASMASQHGSRRTGRNRNMLTIVNDYIERSELREDLEEAADKWWANNKRSVLGTEIAQMLQEDPVRKRKRQDAYTQSWL